MRSEGEIDIAAPPEKVFETLANPQLAMHWLFGAAKSGFTGSIDPENPVGSQWKPNQQIGRDMMDTVITAYDNPNHIAARLTKGATSL